METDINDLGCLGKYPTQFLDVVSLFIYESFPTNMEKSFPGLKNHLIGTIHTLNVSFAHLIAAVIFVHRLKHVNSQFMFEIKKCESLLNLALSISQKMMNNKMLPLDNVDMFQKITSEFGSLFSMEEMRLVHALGSCLAVDKGSFATWKRCLEDKVMKLRAFQQSVELRKAQKNQSMSGHHQQQQNPSQFLNHTRGGKIEKKEPMPFQQSQGQNHHQYQQHQMTESKKNWLLETLRNTKEIKNPPSLGQPTNVNPNMNTHQHQHQQQHQQLSVNTNFPNNPNNPKVTIPTNPTNQTQTSPVRKLPPLTHNATSGSFIQSINQNHQQSIYSNSINQTHPNILTGGNDFMSVNITTATEKDAHHNLNAFEPSIMNRSLPVPPQLQNASQNLPSLMTQKMNKNSTE